MVRTKFKIISLCGHIRRGHIFSGIFLQEIPTQKETVSSRENELRERIPVPHDNYLKSI